MTTIDAPRLPPSPRASGRALGFLGRMAEQRAALIAMIVFVLLVAGAILAPWLTPYEVRQIAAPPLQGPSLEHWLGTDEIGRDLFTRVLHGGRVSIGIGLAASVFAAAVGIPWGLVSGYLGGVTDTVSMRLTDSMLAFPAIILAMATVAVLGSSALNVTIAVGIVQIPRFTRLVRAEALSVREREYVTAAVASGASDLYILVRCILPNVSSTIIVQFTLTFAIAVLTEAGLSFLGLGVQPPQPTWGWMLNTARNYLGSSAHYALVSGVPIFLLVLSLSLIGDALRDVLDPDRVGRRVEKGA